jgi:hypothetical protein
MIHLPQTDPSVSDMHLQLNKVQQSFAKISDPQNPDEKSMMQEANAFALGAELLCGSWGVYLESFNVGDKANTKQCFEGVQSTSLMLKNNLAKIEEALDK